MLSPTLPDSGDVLDSPTVGVTSGVALSAADSGCGDLHGHGHPATLQTGKRARPTRGVWGDAP